MSFKSVFRWVFDGDLGILFKYAPLAVKMKFRRYVKEKIFSTVTIKLFI